MNPEATYDFLSTGVKLQLYFDDFSQSEIQLFCYLSCLLSLYDGHPISFWEYDFIKNEVGSPYSEKLDMAFEGLKTKGLLCETSEGFYRLNSDGEGLYTVLSNFKQNSSRELFLATACDSLSIIPFGQVREAINNEPILWHSRHIQDKRILNDSENVIIENLYRQFKNLKAALNEQNLLVPAVVWIKYLIEQKSLHSDF